MLSEICSIGDVMLGENLYHFRRGIVSRFGNCYRTLIDESVREVLSLDVAALLLNLECSLVPEPMIRDIPETSVYRAPENALSVFDGIGAEVIANVANNHFSQHGQESASFTIDAMRRRGWHVIGIDRAPIEVTVGVRRCKLWGVSLVPDAKACGAYFSSTAETLIGDLCLPAKHPDERWILCIHWGDEYHRRENAEQRSLAHALSRVGFDVILGHHPHVVQPVCRLGPNRTLVAFSHGNFIFDQNFSRSTQTGLVARISLEGRDADLFLSQQKSYRVASVRRAEAARLKSGCNLLPDSVRPFIMRVLMKLELARNWEEVDQTVVRSLLKRFESRFARGARPC